MSRLDDANNDLNLSMREMNPRGAVSLDAATRAVIRVLGNLAVTAAMAYDAAYPVARSIPRESLIYIELISDPDMRGDWVVRLCTSDDRVTRHLDARYSERRAALAHAECFARALGLTGAASNATATDALTWVMKS